MIDLTVLKSYIIEDNQFNDELAEKTIKDIGFLKWFDNHINYWCNCAYKGASGKRIIQTNDKRYNYEITTIINMIEKYATNKDLFYQELINLHNANLMYEELYGFEYDPYSIKSKKSSNSSRKKSKQTSIDFGDKPKKETVAERKLKAHVAKINSFKITLKPVKNDNTI